MKFNKQINNGTLLIPGGAFKISGFEGGEKSYAIQAGREIRIIVQPDKIDDLMAVRTARDISKKIEAELEYPGQIKVVVIRETRATEYAK